MIDLVEAGNEATIKGELKGVEIIEDGNRLIKHAYTPVENMFLQNEARFLKELNNTGFVPKYIKFDYSDASSSISHLVIEDLGKSEPVTNEVEFRRNCALLLWILKKHGVRHGDITPKNIIVKNNRPMLIDFHQSKFDYESGEDKRPEGDAYWMWESALELSPDTSRHIRKWKVIRPLLQSGSFVDMGCAEGDYVLFASSEKTEFKPYLAIDRNMNALEKLCLLWPDSPLKLHVRIWDLAKVDGLTTGRNVLFLSVYAHIVKDYGKQKADAILEYLCNNSRQVFFETQLIGDGPGIHKTDDDVYKFLKQFGKVEKLVTIPVFGREPLSRSVWRIA